MRITVALGAMWMAGTAAAQDALPYVVQVVREHGCTMTGDQAAAVFPAMGITQDQMIDAVEVLVADGRARLEQGDTVIVLSPATCRPVGPSPSLREILLREMRARGCRSEESEMAGLARDAGLAPRDIFEEGQRLIADGLATLEDGMGTLVLTDAACRG